MKPRKLLEKAIRHPNNLQFNELQQLVECFGFSLRRVRGSHHMYARPGLLEQVNLQPDGSRAKPYQVRLFIKLVERCKLTLEDGT
jgi:hypothetical protein